MMQTDPDTESLLWERYLHGRTDEARNKLVNYYADLSMTIARHYYAKRVGGQTDLGDYINYANIGLIQAIEKYKPDYQIKFSSYAQYRIKGSILNHISLFSEKNAQLEYMRKRRSELVASLSSVEESSAQTGEMLLADVVNLTLDFAYSYMLEEGFKQDGEVEQDMVDAYQQCEIDEVTHLLKEYVRSLNGHEKAVIEYYYYYELSFAEIAELLGITRGRVSQIHKQCIQNVRKYYRGVTDINRMF